MPDITVDAKALEAYLPHRGPNILPDSVWMNAERTKAISRTTVPADDRRGRGIFGRTDASGQATWYEPFLAELMALTGVPLLHERLAPQGQVAVFSMISRLTYSKLAPLHGEVVGCAEITRDRGAFTVFSTWAECGGERFLEAEVMSGAATLEAIAGGAPAAAQASPAAQAPLGGQPVDPTLFAWKPAGTRFVDTVVSADRATGKLVAAYRYPTDHAFVPGHFPGGALMMGVTQWAAVADATWLAMRTFGIGPEGVAQGTIRRVDGTEVLDVRDLTLRDEGGVPRIVATKRIAFREKVLPGQAVLIEVTVK